MPVSSRDRFAQRRWSRKKSRPPWPLWAALACFCILLGAFLISAGGVQEILSSLVRTNVAPSSEVESTTQATAPMGTRPEHNGLQPGRRTTESLLAADLKPQKIRSRAQGDGLPPKAPNPWFFLERAYPHGEIPLGQWQQAQIQATQLRAQASREEMWEPAGPTNIGGRVTDVAVHPTDDDIVYVGAAEGGVLRSTNGGQNWTPLCDDLPSLSVGALAIDPSNPDVIYLGTGEVNPGGGSVAYGGLGMFRSADGGDSWESIGLENSGSIGRIRVDPLDPDRIFVAATGHLWTAGPDRGVYRTTNGGASWEQVLFVNDSTGCVDLIMRPDNPDVLYAAAWERIRRPEYYRYGGSGCAVYRSTNGGDSWQVVGGGLPSPNSNDGRIGLSLCAAQPDVMHVVYADRIGYFDGLYRSTDGGYSWSQTNDGALSNVFASYGWWFGNCRTHPVNPNTIFVLGLDFYRSTNGGSSWSEVSGGMHVDHHGLEFGPGSSPVIYNGNDGGVYRSTNGGSAWTKSPNMPITQIYRVALDAGNPNALYCGTQDNGTNRTLTGSLNDWVPIFWGDGFQPLVHPTNSNRIWAEYQYGNLYYSSNGGSSWNWALNGVSGSDRFNWNSPLAQDPTDPDQRYFGTQRLYRSTGTTSWTSISPDLTGGQHQGNSGQVDGILTTIGPSPIDGDVIWTGSDDGYVQVTENGGGSWSNVSAGLPDRWVTSVRPSPHVRETAYVTISGFRWGESLPRVYRTDDLGASWTPIAGNLPDAPVNEILIDPLSANHLVVATDVGVFRTWNGGAVWEALGADLPNVVVTCLAFEAASRRLYAGTYGRSFFACTLETMSDAPAQPDTSPLARSLLLSPRPNPAVHETHLQWSLPEAGTVQVDIYSATGRRVWSSDDRAASAGEGGLRWEGVDQHGRRLGSGAYFARLMVDGVEKGKTTILLQR